VTRSPALRESALGAWLVKARPEGLPLDDLLRDGFGSITSRCVRPTYRTGLVRRGQPVLLWISGGDRRHPSGIYAAGTTTGPARVDLPEPAMPVRLRAVEPVVARAEILARPGFADLEVIRMPAGSNPSYVGTVHYAALLAAFAQLRPDRA
jgi:hypothetical protein